MTRGHEIRLVQRYRPDMNGPIDQNSGHQLATRRQDQWAQYRLVDSQTGIYRANLDQNILEATRLENHSPDQTSTYMDGPYKLKLDQSLIHEAPARTIDRDHHLVRKLTDGGPRTGLETGLQIGPSNGGKPPLAKTGPGHGTIRCLSQAPSTTTSILRGTIVSPYRGYYSPHFRRKTT